MKVVFFSVLSSTPAFLSRPVSHINNFPKSTCQPYKICYRKAYVTATCFKYLIKKKKWYYSTWKIRQRIFLLFYVKDLLTTGKNPWKTTNSTSKVSTSNLLQVALVTRYGRKAGSHWNKKYFRYVFRTQWKIYDGAFSR